MGSSAGGCFLPGDPPPITASTAATASGPAPQLQSLSNTLTGSAYAPSSHVDMLASTMTLAPAGGTVTAVNGVNAIRGEVDLGSGITLSGNSYVTGVYGRGNIHGTVNIGSGDLAAVYAKFDLGSATLTAGHIAPLQSNIVNPPSSPAANVDLLYMESASGTAIHAGIEIIAAATFLFDLTQVSGGSFFVASAVGGSQAAKLKIVVGGTTYYIPLNTA